jgi:N-acetylated-alpha-linked acidic dipeptidase
MLLVLLATATLYNTTLDGPSAETGTARERPLDGRPRVEEILSGTPDADSFGQHLRYLTAEPHRAGTPRNMKLADYVRDHFREFGLDEVRFHDTPALLSSPVSSSVELVAPVRRKLKLREDRIPEDPDSDLYDDPSQVPYHAYAASGDVTAEVVYANSGGPEDFASLEELGIDVRGKIVVMRYSVPYSYRGYKVYQAESRGAAGVIIYSDPQDDGWFKGDVYPEGPWGPDSHVQWGSIVYDWFGPGEPFTFHWKRSRTGSWVEGPERDRQLPRIPSVPMSHEDAAEILSRLRGPVVPSAWQGGLPFTYHVGPGPVRVRLRVENDERIGTMRNVIGMVRGSQEPDRWVIIGNHRDAWIYGAVDPSSGTAALLEVARALGEALEAGYRPRRTIVLANWDAEEDLLGGSTSWVKDFRRRLKRHGVAYVNVDHAALGPLFGGGATPELAAFLREATRAVPNPGAGETLYEAWAARSEDGRPHVEMIVGATDYTAFLEHLGMSCIDMSFGGPYGVYHSQYDSFTWLSRVGDPGFLYNVTMARLWGIVTWRLADAEILPLRYSEYAAALPAYLDAIEEKAGADGPIRLEAARAAGARWHEAATRFESDLAGSASLSDSLSRDRIRKVNTLLLQISRSMTEKKGLQRRAFFKHLIYAPQPTYRPEAAFERAAELLDQASSLLVGEVP